MQWMTLIALPDFLLRGGAGSGGKAGGGGGGGSLVWPVVLWRDTHAIHLSIDIHYPTCLLSR